MTHIHRKNFVLVYTFFGQNYTLVLQNRSFLYTGQSKTHGMTRPHPPSAAIAQRSCGAYIVQVQSFLVLMYVPDT